MSFSIFKKKDTKDVPRLKNGTRKTYDFFAFKLQNITEEGKSLFRKIPKGLYEKPKDIKLIIENDVLIVYSNKTMIGTGDKMATEKFKTNCNKRFEVHSLAIYHNSDIEGYNGKIRVLYYY